MSALTFHACQRTLCIHHVICFHWLFCSSWQLKCFPSVLPLFFLQVGAMTSHKHSHTLPWEFTLHTFQPSSILTQSDARARAHILSLSWMILDSGAVELISVFLAEGQVFPHTLIKITATLDQNNISRGQNIIRQNIKSQVTCCV